MSSNTSRVAGLVLASGLSSRYGDGNKLLARVDGVEVVRRTVTAYLEAGLDGVWVVVGHEAPAVAAALNGLAVTHVLNPSFREGQSRALVHGVRALPADVEAAVIGVADQPLLSAGVIRALTTAYEHSRSSIVAPRYGGRRGNPVLFDRSLFAELLAVTGDQGGRPVIERRLDEVAWLDVQDEEAGLDVDTAADLLRLRRGEPQR